MPFRGLLNEADARTAGVTEFARCVGNCLKEHIHGPRLPPSQTQKNDIFLFEVWPARKALVQFKRSNSAWLHGTVEDAKWRRSSVAAPNADAKLLTG
ncbi:hypothetical protein [Caballeronia sp. RCC_10]|uniref:hypothetical protein n=1 Tax=Caballeronia sp. RCC_10 TaxID=3239227 RepID=UPI0035254421